MECLASYYNHGYQKVGGVYSGQSHRNYPGKLLILVPACTHAVQENQSARRTQKNALVSWKFLTSFRTKTACTVHQTTIGYMALQGVGD